MICSPVKCIACISLVYSRTEISRVPVTKRACAQLTEQKKKKVKHSDQPKEIGAYVYSRLETLRGPLAKRACTKLTENQVVCMFLVQ